jgi:shikimate kinase
MKDIGNYKGIVLVGTIHAGKTTTAKALVEMLPDSTVITTSDVVAQLRKFEKENPDADLGYLTKHLCAEKNHLDEHPKYPRPEMQDTITHFMEHFGDEAFAMLCYEIARQIKGPVVLEGLRPGIRFIKEKGFYIAWLDAPISTLIERITKSQRKDNSRSAAEILLNEERTYNISYRAKRFCHCMYDTSARTPEQIAQEILSHCMQ